MELFFLIGTSVLIILHIIRGIISRGSIPEEVGFWEHLITIFMPDFLIHTLCTSVGTCAVYYIFFLFTHKDFEFSLTNIFALIILGFIGITGIAGILARWVLNVEQWINGWINNKK
jgi:hypothetical protein